MDTLTRLAGELAALPPSVGPVRLVAVDGHAGSGKSTFAGRLAEALGGAPVLPLDSLASHAEPFGWTGRLRRQVLEPFERGRTAHYAPYDWIERRYRTPLPLPAAPVVLVEGVGAGRRALRPSLACQLWMDVPAAEAWRCGRRRDGPALDAFWDGWEAAERRHFAADPSRPYARLLIRRRAGGHGESGGYDVFSGPDFPPAHPPGDTQRITESEVERKRRQGGAGSLL
ncbi:uridine kinase [Streptomyces sp. NPDC050560]|uniref:uridine kinase n=1 Tax=Streptomyces sp. NPDC050560 TaxID=3365630 RepID=UPI0037A09FCE